MKKLNLDRRERIGLVCGVLALCTVLALLVYIPRGPKRDYERSKQRVAQAREDLDMAELLKVDVAQQLADQKELKERLKHRDPRFDLTAFIDRALRDTQLKDRARLENVRAGRRDSGKVPRVELSLDSISLKELVDFLYRVYASENLVVLQKVDIRPAPRDQGLNCDLTLATVKV